MFRWLRRLRRPLWFIFLVFLPLSPFIVLSWIVGGFEGLFLANYEHAVFEASSQHFASNVAAAQSMDFYSVPGAPGIHDIGIAPYYVPQLRDPTNWWTKLGLKRFDITPGDKNSPIGQFARLDTLYRKVRRYEQSVWHHWVYASGQSLRMDGIFFDEWDEAFDQLLRYHYRHPAIGNAQFHFLECPGNFLCDRWLTRGPALLHFTTGVADVWADSDPDARPHIPGYAPVTVRIMELPIDDQLIPLYLPNTFPSQFEQMKILTSDLFIWELWGIYSYFEQTVLRLDDIVQEKEKEFPNTYGRLIALDHWLWKQIPLSEEMAFWPSIVLSLVRLVGIASSFIAWNGMGIAADMFGRFLGTSITDRQHREMIEEEAQGERLETETWEDNFMAQMLKNFTDSLGDDFKAVEDSPEGRELMQSMWDIVKQPPPSESED